MNEDNRTVEFIQHSTGIRIVDPDLTLGKVVINDIEITDIKNWNKVIKSLEQLKQENKQLKELKQNRGKFIIEQRNKIEDMLIKNIEDEVVLGGILNYINMLNLSIDTQLKTINSLKEQNKELHNKIDAISKANKTWVKQVVERDNKIDKAIKLIEDSYYSKNTTDIDSIVVSSNKLIQIRKILKDSDVDEN